MIQFHIFLSLFFEELENPIRKREFWEIFNFHFKRLYSDNVFFSHFLFQYRNIWLANIFWLYSILVLISFHFEHCLLSMSPNTSIYNFGLHLSMYHLYFSFLHYSVLFSLLSSVLFSLHSFKVHIYSYYSNYLFWLLSSAELLCYLP